VFDVSGDPLRWELSSYPDWPAEAKDRLEQALTSNTAGFTENYDRIVETRRQRFTQAGEYRSWLETEYPELDAETEYLKKLVENRIDRILEGDRFISFRGLLGTRITKLVPCGYSELTVKLDASNIKAAVSEYLVDGDITLFTVNTSQQRKRVVRRLKRAGEKYKVYPTSGGYDIIAGANLVGEFGGVLLDQSMLTDSQAKRWASTPVGERSTGNLIPSRRALRGDCQTQDSVFE
jgi:hypothetical protein